MPAFRVLPDADAVASEAAAIVAGEVSSGLSTLVLAGGSTPRRAYELLAEMPDVPWGRVTILFGDERCVRPFDPESNYRMAFESLISKVHPFSVTRIPGELGAETAARHYEWILSDLLPLDLVLLGIGEDGHTASLFPDSPALTAPGNVIAVHDAPKPPPDRVSLTLGVLRAARHVVILAAGAGKAEAVRLAREGTVPAGMIPHAEFLLDAAAAGEE
jgi:6-phosphogluconolactonase